MEPDGESGHWLKLDKKAQKAVGLKPGARAKLDIETVSEWPEPKLPEDLEAALATAPQKIQRLWSEITSMARWEWVRWVNSTRNPATRQRRVKVTVSKLTAGKRRPCCFDLSACTDPDLCRNGRLIEQPVLSDPAHAR